MEHVLSSVIIIPAYEPDNRLFDLVEQIQQQSPLQNFIIIDDGSTSIQSLEVFELLKNIQNVHLLKHEHNKGKGAALKTGFQHFLKFYPTSAGVVTADADGQHLAKDILNVSTALTKPNQMILGVRQFDPNVPLRSRFGNVLTRKVFGLLSNVQIQDTQTGLRALSHNLISPLLDFEEDGYAFEMHMLITATKENWNIIEVPIQTVYIEQNRSSHFNPLWDSLKIYFVFLRYSVLSLLSAGLDFLLFFITFYYSKSIVTSTIFARILSGIFNFTYAKKWIFKSKGKMMKESFHYLCLAVTSMMLSCLFVSILFHLVGFNIFWSKLTSDSLIFLGNFLIQRFIIFKSAEA